MASALGHASQPLRGEAARHRDTAHDLEPNSAALRSSSSPPIQSAPTPNGRNLGVAAAQLATTVLPALPAVHH
jgi:hypothetical protein